MGMKDLIIVALLLMLVAMYMKFNMDTTVENEPTTVISNSSGDIKRSDTITIQIIQVAPIQTSIQDTQLVATRVIMKEPIRKRERYPIRKAPHLPETVKEKLNNNTHSQ